MVETFSGRKMRREMVDLKTRPEEHHATTYKLGVNWVDCMLRQDNRVCLARMRIEIMKLERSVNASASTTPQDISGLSKYMFESA